MTLKKEEQQPANNDITENDEDLAALYDEIMSDADDLDNDDLEDAEEDSDESEPNDLPNPDDDEDAADDINANQDNDDQGDDVANDDDESDDNGVSDSELNKRLELAEQRAKSAQGRVGALTRSIEDIKKTSVSLNDLKGKNLEELKEDYPDLAAALGDVVTGLNSSFASKSTRSLELLLSDAQQEQVTSTDELHQVKRAAVSESYPNWETVWDSDDFAKWYESLPEEVQALADSNSPQAIVHLLDNYNRDKPDQLKPTQSQLNRNRLLGHSRGNTRAPTTPQKHISDDNLAEIYEDVFDD